MEVKQKFAKILMKKAKQRYYKLNPNFKDINKLWGILKSDHTPIPDWWSEWQSGFGIGIGGFKPGVVNVLSVGRATGKSTLTEQLTMKVLKNRNSNEACKTTIL